MHLATKLAGGATAAGAVAAAYSTGYEVRAFRLRRQEVACLPPGAEPLTVLHLSDLHLTPTQHKKRRWLAELGALKPDLVINTGDYLSHAAAVPYVVAALGDLLQVPGVFVLGSNDYWGPVKKNPMRYLLPSGGRRRIHGPPLPSQTLRDELGRRGWLDLTNTVGTLMVGATRIAFAGVDDPHLGYDRLDRVAGRADPSADLRIGVTHAPYLRVLNTFAQDGYDAIFAGHTHGGQLRVPWYGALVTNCDLDRKRARGLHTHSAGDRTAWLHVSAGLGTSPYAPFRFCCYPEASLVTLTATTGSDQPSEVGAGAALR